MLPPTSPRTPASTNANPPLLLLLLISTALQRSSAFFTPRMPFLIARTKPTLQRASVTVAPSPGIALPPNTDIHSTTPTPQAKRRISSVLSRRRFGSVRKPGAGGCWGEMNAQARALQERLFAADERAVVLFDGHCVFCNAVVNICLALDGGDKIRGSMRYAPLQGKVGQQLLECLGMSTTHFSSAILVEPDRISTKSDAVIRICKRLRLPFPVLAMLLMFLPKGLRDFLYEWVSARRHWFGRRDECRIPEEHEEERFIEWE